MKKHFGNPLDLAVALNWVKLVKLLLSNGADEEKEQGVIIQRVAYHSLYKVLVGLLNTPFGISSGNSFPSRPYQSCSNVVEEAALQEWQETH